MAADVLHVPRRRRDHDFAAALIPEPTAFGIAAEQAGALTFSGTIPGVPAHAARAPRSFPRSN